MNKMSTSVSSINGELWNEAEVLKYLKFVYNPNHIVHGDKVKKILDDLQDKLSSPEDSIFEEAHEKIMNYCHRR